MKSKNLFVIAWVATIALGLIVGFGAWTPSPEAIGAGLMMANAPVALPELKTLIESIQKGFSDYRELNDRRYEEIKAGKATGDFDAKLAKVTEDLAQMMDLKKTVEQLEAKSNRTALSLGAGKTGATEDDLAHKNAFFGVGGFIRKGNSTGLEDMEKKSWSVVVAADGGYGLPKVVDSEIDQLLRDVSPMRQLARVIQIGTSDYNRLVNKNGVASGWVGEKGARPETATSAWDNFKPFMGELYANPMVTQTSLDDLIFDVEGEIKSQLAEEFAVAEGAAFVTGDGSNKPKGFLAYPTAATSDSTRAYGTVEHVATGVSGAWPASNPANFLYDIVAKLKKGYRAGSVWSMPKSLMFEIMKFTDTTGQYLWQPSFKDGIVMNLLGYPVWEMEDMPVKAANSLSIAYGNFKRAYIIADRMGTRVLRDPYTNKPYVGFYTTKRVGGGLLNSEAIKVGKFAVS